jgi:hypothetical protein
MTSWIKWWPLARDILLTGTGMGVIIMQVFSRHPSTPLLWTGLALTVPSVVEHVKALLPASPAPDTSPSSLPSGESPSSTSPSRQQAEEASSGE